MRASHSASSPSVGARTRTRGGATARAATPTVTEPRGAGAAVGAATARTPCSWPSAADARARRAPCAPRRVAERRARAPASGSRLTNAPASGRVRAPARRPTRRSGGRGRRTTAHRRGALRVRDDADGPRVHDVSGPRSASDAAPLARAPATSESLSTTSEPSGTVAGARTTGASAAPGRTSATQKLPEPSAATGTPAGNRSSPPKAIEAPVKSSSTVAPPIARGCAEQLAQLPRERQAELGLERRDLRVRSSRSVRAPAGGIAVLAGQPGRRAPLHDADRVHPRCLPRRGFHYLRRRGTGPPSATLPPMQTITARKTIAPRRSLLRTALTLDAGVTAANGAAYLALAGPLHDLLGLSEAVLRGAGVFLLVYAARRRRARRAAAARERRRPRRGRRRTRSGRSTASSPRSPAGATRPPPARCGSCSRRSSSPASPRSSSPGLKRAEG